MKTKITKEEYHQILGLMLLARNAYAQIKECEKAYGKIVEMEEDYGSFGHFSDEIFGDGDVNKVLKNEGISVLTCHDENCPKCGFPETLDVRDAETMNIKRRICSKRCGWEISGKKLLK